MNQPNPMPRRRPNMPQGQRPQGGARRPQGGAPAHQGSQEGGEGQPPRPVAKGGNPWPIAIALTVILLGAAAWVLMSNKAEQEEIDLNANLPTAYGQLFAGNTEDAVVKETGILDGISEADVAAIAGTRTAGTYLIKPKDIPAALDVDSVADSFLHNTLENSGRLNDFIEENFPICRELADENRQIELMIGTIQGKGLKKEQVNEFIIRFYQASNRAKIYHNLVKDSKFLEDANIAKGFIEAIEFRLGGLASDAQKSQKGAKKDLSVVSNRLADIHDEKDTDQKTIDRLAFADACYSALQGEEAMSIAEVKKIRDDLAKGNSSADLSDLEILLKRLNTLKDDEGRNFDEMVEYQRKEVRAALKKLSEGFSTKVNEAVDEAKTKRAEAFEMLKARITKYIAAKEAALAALKRVGEAKKLMSHDGVSNEITKYNNVITAAKAEMKKLEAEMAK